MSPPEPRAATAEVHVPISPTTGFFNRVRLLAASLREFGGALAGAPVVVTVGRECEPYDLASALPWSTDLGIEWRWMDAERFAEHSYYGTALERFTYAFDAPFVVMLDADTIVTGPLDDLLELAEHDAIGGAVAHLAPTVAVSYRDGVARDGETFWHDLHARSGLVPPTLPLEHTGWGILDAAPDRRFCPAYFNLGVLAAPAQTMERIGSVIYESMADVDRFVDTNFRCQLAVTLAIARVDCAWCGLPPRWNFPNDDAFLDRYQDDARDVRVLHYLRDTEVDREADMGSPEGLARLLDRDDLSPMNHFLRLHVEAVAEGLGLPAYA